MSIEPNKAVARRFNDEIANEPDEAARVAAVDALFASDFVAYRSGHVAFTGRDRMREFARSAPRIYGRMHVALDDLIAEGDKVAARWTLTGMHEGELLGIPPTGKPLTITGINIYQIADGQIVALWAEEDFLGALRQMGALPTKPPPGE